MAVADDFDFEEMAEEAAKQQATAAASAPSAGEQAAMEVMRELESVPDAHKEEFLRWKRDQMVKTAMEKKVRGVVESQMKAREARLDAELEEADEAYHRLTRDKDGRYEVDAEACEEADKARAFDTRKFSKLAEISSKFDAEEALDADVDDDLSSMRAKRAKALRKRAEKRGEWMRKGHGSMSRVKDQKEWFELAKRSERVIALFNNDSNVFGRQLGEHLQTLAAKHMETKFVEMEVTDAPFLVERFEITMTPTIVLAKKGKVDRKLIGLDWVAPDGKIDGLFLEQKLFEYGFFEETYMILEKDRRAADAMTAMPKDDSADDLDLD
jgi:hypothetical protein